MKSFRKFFWFLFLIFVSCGQKTPSSGSTFSILWEWQAPQNAFIQDATSIGEYVFLTLNTGEVAFFPVARPHEIRLFPFPLTGVVSLTWISHSSNEFLGIAWTTTGNTQSLVWFSFSPWITNTTNSSQISAFSPLASLTYQQISGIAKIAHTLFWVADGFLFSQDIQSSFLPNNPSSLPMPYAYRIWHAIQYQHILYLAQGDKGLTLVDLKRNKTTNYSWIIGSIGSLLLLPEEKKLILADRINGVRAYDISSPWTPTFHAVYEALGNTMDIALTKQGLWLADQYNGISLLKLEEKKFILLTNIQGRVMSHVLSLDNGEKLLFWHQDKILLTSVNAP
ncbi:MAG: hypothetical protein N2314_08810 [Brevinematales bacterium]|nr:hypothetical protein [Brevinematales bacterium]